MRRGLAVILRGRRDAVALLDGVLRHRSRRGVSGKRQGEGCGESGRGERGGFAVELHDVLLRLALMLQTFTERDRPPKNAGRELCVRSAYRQRPLITRI